MIHISHPKTVANWVLNEILRVVPPDDEKAIAACPIKPADLAGLIALIEDGTISGRIAKDVFEKMLVAGESARAIVSREGLMQVADPGELGTVVDRVLAERLRQVDLIAWESSVIEAARKGTAVSRRRGDHRPST